MIIYNDLRLEVDIGSCSMEKYCFVGHGDGVYDVRLQCTCEYSESVHSSCRESKHAGSGVSVCDVASRRTGACDDVQLATLSLSLYHRRNSNEHHCRLHQYLIAGDRCLLTSTTYLRCGRATNTS